MGTTRATTTETLLQETLETIQFLDRKLLILMRSCSVGLVTMILKALVVTIISMAVMEMISYKQEVVTMRSMEGLEMMKSASLGLAPL